MDGKFVRTSVTVDEAVAILLGWANGPVVFSSPDQNLSDEEKDILDSATFSLTDELEERLCSCQNDLEHAKDDGQSEAVIVEKREAIEKQLEVERMASTYLCAVNDEINKGEQSGLRVDNDWSNSYFTYITLTSLDEWASSRYGRKILWHLKNSIQPTALRTNVPSGPRTKMRAQEAAVLKEIERQGHKPKHLPLTVGSTPGVKAAVKKALAVNPLFHASRAFDKTWDQLRKDGSIANAD